MPPGTLTLAGSDATPGIELTASPPAGAVRIQGRGSANWFPPCRLVCDSANWAGGGGVTVNVAVAAMPL